MRTTLDIDDDVLAFARSIAGPTHKSLGAVVSEFARQGIQKGAAHQAVGVASETELSRKLRKLGLVSFPRKKGAVVTDDLVKSIRESEGV